jgi:hypothetical protein
MIHKARKTTKQKSMKSNKFAKVLVLLMILAISACTSTRYLAPAEGVRIMEERVIYILLEDNTELKLTNCVLTDDRLVGFQKNGERVEVETFRIRAVYIKKLKPAVPILGALTACTIGVAIWLMSAADAAP